MANKVINIFSDYIFLTIKFALYRLNLLNMQWRFLPIIKEILFVNFLYVMMPLFNLSIIHFAFELNDR